MKDLTKPILIPQQPCPAILPAQESNDDILEQMYEQEFNKMLFDMYIQDRIEHDFQRLMEDNYVPELDPKK